jgi:hypothetical protein
MPVCNACWEALALRCQLPHLQSPRLTTETQPFLREAEADLPFWQESDLSRCKLATHACPTVEQFGGRPLSDIRRICADFRHISALGPVSHFANRLWNAVFSSGPVPQPQTLAQSRRLDPENR